MNTTENDELLRSVLTWETAYFSSVKNMPETVTFHLNIKKIKEQEATYRLNQRLRGEYCPEQSTATQR